MNISIYPIRQYTWKTFNGTLTYNPELKWFFSVYFTEFKGKLGNNKEEQKKPEQQEQDNLLVKNYTTYEDLLPEKLFFNILLNKS